MPRRKASKRTSPGSGTVKKVKKVPKPRPSRKRKGETKEVNGQDLKKSRIDPELPEPENGISEETTDSADSPLINHLYDEIEEMNKQKPDEIFLGEDEVDEISFRVASLVIPKSTSPDKESSAGKNKTPVSICLPPVKNPALWAHLFQQLHSHNSEIEEKAMQTLLSLSQSSRFKLTNAPPQLIPILIGYVGIYDSCKQRENVETNFREKDRVQRNLDFLNTTVHPISIRNFLCSCIDYYFPNMLNFDVLDVQMALKSRKISESLVRLETNQKFIREMYKAGFGDEASYHNFRNSLICTDVINEVGKKFERIAVILRNMTLDRLNAYIVSKNKGILRFVLILIHCSWKDIRCIGLEILSNISRFMILSEPISDYIQSVFYPIVFNGLKSKSRFSLLKAVQVMRGWICYCSPRNPNASEKDLTPVRNMGFVWSYLHFSQIVPRLLLLLVYPEAEILECILQTLSVLSAHKESQKVCGVFVRAPGFIKVLVFLLFSRETDFGKDPQAIFGVRDYFITLMDCMDSSSNEENNNNEKIDWFRIILKSLISSVTEDTTYRFSDLDLYYCAMMITDFPSIQPPPGLLTLVKQLGSRMPPTEASSRRFELNEAIDWAIFEKQLQDECICGRQKAPSINEISEEEEKTKIADIIYIPNSKTFEVSTAANVNFLSESTQMISVNSNQFYSTDNFHSIDLIKSILSPATESFPNCPSCLGEKKKTLNKAQPYNSTAYKNEKVHAIKYLAKFYQMDDSNRLELNELYKAYKYSRLSLGAPFILFCSCKVLKCLKEAFNHEFPVNEMHIGGIRFIFVKGIKMKKGPFKISFANPHQEENIKYQIFTCAYGKSKPCFGKGEKSESLGSPGPVKHFLSQILSNSCELQKKQIKERELLNQKDSQCLKNNQPTVNDSFNPTIQISSSTLLPPSPMNENRSGVSDKWIEHRKEIIEIEQEPTNIQLSISRCAQCGKKKSKYDSTTKSNSSRLGQKQPFRPPLLIPSRPTDKVYPPYVPNPVLKCNRRNSSHNDARLPQDYFPEFPDLPTPNYTEEEITGLTEFIKILKERFETCGHVFEEPYYRPFTKDAPVKVGPVADTIVKSVCMLLTTLVQFSTDARRLMLKFEPQLSYLIACDQDYAPYSKNLIHILNCISTEPLSSPTPPTQ